MLVSSFARSFKEAQTYISLMIIVPMAPSIIAQLYSLGNEWWMAPIPVLGQQVLMTEVVSGEPVSLLSYAATGLSSLVLGPLCVWVTARLLHARKRRLLHGRTGVQPDDAAGSSSSFSISRAMGPLRRSSFEPPPDANARSLFPQCARFRDKPTTLYCPP